MSLLLPPTRFAVMPRRAALLVIVALVVALVACILASLAPVPSFPQGTVTTGDLAMYERLVERLRTGESYYAILHDELLSNGYGVQSVFNWRTPFFATLLRVLPSLDWGQWLLIGIAVAASIGAVVVLWRDGNWAIAGAAIPLLIFSLGTSLAFKTVLFSELTAGALVLLSAVAYGLRWRWVGIVAAVLALFVRELAAPFVLVAIWLAWRERRRPELIGWGIALLAYAVYFGWHFAMVQASQLPTDPPNTSTWLAFGGVQFLVRTAAFNGMFALFPLWVSALVLPLGLLGLAAWPGATGRLAAITVAAYLVLFAVAGKTVNDYWGGLYTPLLTLGLVWAPAAIRDLVVRSRRSSSAVREDEPRSGSSPRSAGGSAR